MLRSSSASLQRLGLSRLSQQFESSLSLSKQLPSRSLSSVAPKKKNSKDSQSVEDGAPLEKSKKQPFATASLLPGEWDENRTDPYFRPPPPKQRKVLSAEDFANRPPVGFDGEFSTYEDAMITLSWLDHKTCKTIYQAYVDMMVLSQQNHKVTSHEYATRVIAQQFNLTTTRAAGIIQLQHAEEQMRQHSPELLCEEQAQYAEQTILQNIRDAYKAERQPLPQSGDGRIPFVEDPVGIHGRGEPDETSTQWTQADDMYDMEQKLAQANVRDTERAQLLINGHVYKTDVDENQEFVRTDATCRKLIQSKEKQNKDSKTAMGKDSNSGSIPYPETNAKGERRDRWKFVAKVVNTRQLKKKGSRSTAYTNNNTTNTLVEHNGELRVATVAEAKQAAWKPTRTGSNEYLYEGAKSAWLEKTLNGKTGVWGAAPKTRASDATKAAAAAAKSEAAPTSEKSAKGEEKPSQNDDKATDEEKPTANVTDPSDSK